MPEQPPDPDQLDQHDVTAPPDPTHEATTPPANPETDDEAVRKGEEQLDRAGGGH